jgi:AraC family transcriptional regulator
MRPTSRSKVAGPIYIGQSTAVPSLNLKSDFATKPPILPTILETSMNSRRVYGDAIAHSLGLADAPTIFTKSLKKSQVGMSRLSIGAKHLGMTPRIPSEDTFIVAMYLTDVRHHELWRRGRPFLMQGYAANAIRIVNLVEEFSALIACPHETIVFYIPRAVMNEFTDDAGSRRIANLACTPGIIDPIVVQLATALLPAFERPHEASSLFVDHVALAICAHLAHSYGGFRPPDPHLAGRLAPYQAKRAKDFLANHCADQISLKDVAQECGLSRGYFTEAFRVTTGLTPHQWLQQYRIDKAKAMLLESSTPIADIAIACGFADQSHLTRIFSRFVGSSPAAWRRRHRDWPNGASKDA